MSSSTTRRKRSTSDAAAVGGCRPGDPPDGVHRQDPDDGGQLGGPPAGPTEFPARVSAPVRRLRWLTHLRVRPALRRPPHPIDPPPSGSTSSTESARELWCREGESNPHGREGPRDFECKLYLSKINNFKHLGMQDAAKYTIS